MAAGFEREIKLRFAHAAGARAAAVAAGARLTRARRLQQDALLDTAEGLLRDRNSALRVRVEDGRATLTFKGPVQPSAMKFREEIETPVADAQALFALFDRLGFRVWFRYEKFREEYTLSGCVAAVDETPVGTFVELEGEEAAIEAAAAALGRTPNDFVLDSYRGLQVQRCTSLGLPVSDMVFTTERP